MKELDKGQSRSEMRKQFRRERLVVCLICVLIGFLLGLALGRILPDGSSIDSRPAASPTATAEPTETAAASPTATAEPTATAAASPTATAEPTATATLAPTATAEPTETAAASPTATAEPTATATLTLTATAEPTATATLTLTATAEPEGTPDVQTEVSAAPVNPMIQKEPEQYLPLEGVRIGIDPGHQIKGNNEKEPVSPGSSETKSKVSSGTQGVSTRVPEYQVNLDVSLQLRDALTELGAEVFMTREVNEIDISNVERATMMNEIGVDLVLRLHCNGSTDQSVSGISLYVKPDGEGAEESYLASEALMTAMLDATGAKNKGIHKRDTYSGLNWSTVPSILVEMGFMSNPEEDELLNDPDYQQLLVNGMVRGIADYMGRALVEE